MNRVTYSCFTSQCLATKSWKSICWVRAGSQSLGFGCHWLWIPFSVDSISSIITTPWGNDWIFEVKMSFWDMSFRYSSIFEKEYIRLVLV